MKRSMGSTNPLLGMTYLRFGDLQISHLDATGREIGDLELDVDGPFRFAYASGSAHAASEPTGHTAAALVVALDGG